MVYGDVPQNGINDPDAFLFPPGVLLDKNLAEVLPVDPRNPAEITEQVAHSWYSYPGDTRELHPFEGVTEPNYTDPSRPTSISTRRAPTRGSRPRAGADAPSRSGPLARMLVGYASGRDEFREVVDEALGRLGVPATALFSTSGARRRAGSRRGSAFTG